MTYRNYQTVNGYYFSDVVNAFGGPGQTIASGAVDPSGTIVDAAALTSMVRHSKSNSNWHQFTESTRCFKVEVKLSEQNHDEFFFNIMDN